MPVVDLTSPDSPPAPLVKKRPMLNNRNTDHRFNLSLKRRAPSSSSTTTSSIRPTRRKTSTRGKKRCDLGGSCPYKEEYQHQLEFSHDEESTRVSSSTTTSRTTLLPGKGHKLGGQNHSLPSSTYKGEGGEIGSGRSVIDLLNCNSKEDDVCDKNNNVNYDIQEYVECIDCGKVIELYNYDSHLRTHEVKNHPSNNIKNNNNDQVTVRSSPTDNTRAASILIQQQDEEYDKAELEDLKKLHNKITSNKSTPDIITIEDDEDVGDSSSGILIPSISASIISSESTRTLSGPIISLAFKFKVSSESKSIKLPSKLVETFHTDSLLQVT